MNPYEVMLLLDPELSEERQEEIVSRVRQLVDKAGGTWVAHEPWGRRKLAYEIDKKPEAHYHLLQLDCDATTLAELTRILKITDGALRHMAVRRPVGQSPPKRPPTKRPAETVKAAE